MLFKNVYVCVGGKYNQLNNCVLSVYCLEKPGDNSGNFLDFHKCILYVHSSIQKTSVAPH